MKQLLNAEHNFLDWGSVLSQWRRQRIDKYTLKVLVHGLGILVGINSHRLQQKWSVTSTNDSAFFADQQTSTPFLTAAKLLAATRSRLNKCTGWFLQRFVSQ